MKAAVLRILPFGLSLAVFAAPGAGAPLPPSGAVPLHLTAGPVRLEPADAGRRAVPRISGFGLGSRPGEPMLPLRRFLVAIPEGSVPGLQVLSAPSEGLRGVDIAPVPRLRVRDRKVDRRGAEAFGDAAIESEEDFEGDAAIFGRDAEFPGSPVRLGSIGYLREQRFVEVIYTPVLYNPGRREARYFPDIRAEVRFMLPEGREPSAAPPAFRPDPLFEETYRRSLLNYEQGKAFRVPRGGALRTAADPTASLSTAAATSVESGTAAVTAPGAPRYKIMVSKAGIYRLDYAYLSNRAPDVLSLDPRTLVLRAEGMEIPIAILGSAGESGEADGRFDAADVLLFYGRPRTEPPAVLNHDSILTLPDVYQANDFTDTQVYWLSSEGAPGSHARIPEVDGAPVPPGFPTATDFEEKAVWDENNLYLPLADADPFFSVPSLLAGSDRAQRDVSLALPGLAPSPAAARVTVRLRGGSSLAIADDHRTRVWINGDVAGAADFTWDGEVIKEWEFSEPRSALTDPATIHLSAPGLPDVAVDRQYPDSVTIRYRRVFVAAGDVLAFGYPNQDVRFQVAGFAGPSPVIYDVSRAVPGTNEASPVAIVGAAVSGAPPFTYAFDAPADRSATAPASRAFVVAGPGGLLIPDGMGRAADPVLRDPANGADDLVIASRDTVDASPGGALDSLLAHRLATQGLTSRVVFVDQIYDEFSFGLRDANALRAFVAYAFENWKGSDGTARPPSFVLLVGDATADYKDTLGLPAWVDQVPTPMMFQVSSILGYYSSDNWIAAFRGDDQIPDVHLGRISTRTVDASAAVFRKILRYEQSPPPGPWKGRGVFLASDGRSSSESGEFERIQTGVTGAYFSIAPFSAPDPPLYFARPPWNSTDAAGYKNAIIDQLNSGAAVVSYIGHGAFETWGLTTFFRTLDAEGLTNDGPLPFLVNADCLAGGFHSLSATPSLGEGMTNNPAGGAIATLAPSGLSNALVGQVVSDGLFDALFGPRTYGPERARILGLAADILRAELWSQSMVVDMQGYTFLGDPATVLATPAPPPPAGLSAVAGNGEVTLSWSAPAEPVAGYRIYRAAKYAAGPYAAVACDALTGTSCVDRTVINATAYYYYAVSRDTEGFEGRASNSNRDCDGGPDCVRALPINPGPPSAPTGLAAADAGTGGTLLISWQANPERDVSKYTLHYGTLPGQYAATAGASAGLTTITLTGLTDSVRYYMALSATNTSGHESTLSSEVSGVPHLVQGIAPPRSISDLMVSRSGPDLVLSWSRPTVDIYGRPTTVVRYDVYRGTSPGFRPLAGSPLVTITDPANTSLTDAGAAVLPSDVYYAVTATDSQGLVSGAGRELPNGVSDLRLAWLPASGQARLAWSPVATDIAGLPTVVDHYEVHRSDRPLAREGLSAATLVANVTAAGLDLPAAGSPVYFTVIVVDNQGNSSPF